jgi:hypothetical protein
LSPPGPLPSEITVELIFTFILPLFVYGWIAETIASCTERDCCIEAGKQAHCAFRRWSSHGDFWKHLQNKETFYDNQIAAHEAHLKTLSPPQRIELGR